MKLSLSFFFIYFRSRKSRIDHFSYSIHISTQFKTIKLSIIVLGQRKCITGSVKLF